MASLIQSLRDRIADRSARQILVPAGVIVLAGCGISCYVISGPSAGTVRNLEAGVAVDEAEGAQAEPLPLPRRISEVEPIDVVDASRPASNPSQVAEDVTLKRSDLADTGTTSAPQEHVPVLPNADILPQASKTRPANAVTSNEIETATENLQGTNSMPPVSALELAPLPTDEAISTARTQVQSILKSEYAAAKTRDRQRELSRTLLELSQDFE